MIKGLFIYEPWPCGQDGRLLPKMRLKNLTTACLCPTWSPHLEPLDTRDMAPQVTKLINCRHHKSTRNTKRCFKWRFSPNLVQRDELREIFNDISSSSEDEDEEGERHEDEDLNIMDTEDDMVRQLHEKLSESDGGRDENDRNSQIGKGCLNQHCSTKFKIPIRYRRGRPADKQQPT